MRKPGSRIVKRNLLAVVAALLLGSEYSVIKYLPPTSARDWFCVEDTESFELA